MKSRISVLLLISLVLKLLIALVVPLVLDEYYYFLWGHKLSLSYFDHPPMVGWMMVLSQKFQLIAEGAIRWPFILMSQATLWIWYKILKGEVKESYLFWFVLVGLLNPLWGLGAFVASPDIPLLFFWTASLYFTKRVIAQFRWQDYILLGVSLALGFLSKYQIILFVPSLLIMLEQQKLFPKLFTWKTLAAILVALGVCFPVLYWNYTHDWASFKFQWAHGMTAKQWRWYYPLDFLAVQILLVFPTFFVFMFQKNRKWLNHWLFPFAFFPALFFFYSSSRGKVEANWLIMAFPTIYALSFIFLTDKVFPWVKRTVYLWSAATLVLLIIIPLKGSLDSKKVRLFESDKYKDVLPFIKPDQEYFAYNYQMAGYLGFYTRRLICKLPKYGRVDHFSYMPECSKLPDRFFYITEHYMNFPIDKDFPGYVVVAKHKIDGRFIGVEVQRR